MYTKKSRLLLLLQGVVLCPPIIFIFIYAHHPLYILAALGLCTMIGINIYRYNTQKRVIRFPLWFILIISFLLYAFHHLGSREVPQTGITVKQNDTLFFHFEKPIELDQICYYTGIDKTAWLTIYGKQMGRWHKIEEIKENFPFSFRWKCIDTKTKVTDIRFNIVKSEMMLEEVTFFAKGKRIPFSTQVHALADEQFMKVDMTFFGGMFFDEIYHSRTAYEILHGINVYETTHPYLGKLLIIPGIELFGMTPYGWRFTNVVFAALFIWVMYYFASYLFRQKTYAVMAAFFLTYSFMHFTQARIGLIDTFGVFFVFTSYYFLYRFIQEQHLRLLLISGVFFGFASAVKWSAVFAALGFVMIAFYLLLSRYRLQKRFAGYRLLLYGLLSYGGVAGGIYLLSFFDIYLQTGSFAKIIDYQFNMYAYHSHLVSSHPYSSPWWSWPIDYKPMCYYRQIHDGRFSSITAFGNPALFWAGTASLVYLAYLNIKRCTVSSMFILLAFLGLYLPYIFIGRLMFIYHFYYAVPFMFLALVYSIRDLMHRSQRVRQYLWVYLSIVALLFLAYYPVLSGYEVPKAYVDYLLKWFPWWWL
jgi:dolichyl-phosphate-mannose--protein O-mannosyl transferase